MLNVLDTGYVLNHYKNIGFSRPELTLLSRFIDKKGMAGELDRFLFEIAIEESTGETRFINTANSQFNDEKEEAS